MSFRNATTIGVAMGLAVLSLHGGKVTANEAVTNAITDAEEMAADSEAALRLARDAKARAAKEREENARALADANRVRKAADEKKQQAQSELRRTEQEIQGLTEEQAKIRFQTKRHEADSAEATRVIEDSRARVAKTKQELETLIKSRDEARARLDDLKRQRDEAHKETALVQQERDRAEAMYDSVHDAEKQATRELERTKIEESRKREIAMAEIERLKERYKTASRALESARLESEKQRQATARADANLAVARDEVRRVESAPIEIGTEGDSRTLAANLTPPQISEKPAKETPVLVASVSEGANSSEKMTLRIDCNVRSGPSRSSEVLGTELAGTALPRGEVNNGWVLLPYAGGKTGYVARSCF